MQNRVVLHNAGEKIDYCVGDKNYSPYRQKIILQINALYHRDIKKPDTLPGKPLADSVHCDIYYYMGKLIRWKYRYGQLVS